MSHNADVLHIETTKPLLYKVLTQLMEEPLLNPFVLVGGTSLSLRLGHRMSDDIDLFTDYDYGSLDFAQIERYLSTSFNYFNQPSQSEIVGFGRKYFVGETENKCIKLDLMYTDPYFEHYNTINGIRMATLKQIAAMKMQAISGGGRKKDWWDIHELLNYYSLSEMIGFHKKWQEWSHDTNELLNKLTAFSIADEEPDPVCLKGKNWEFIKMDIIDEVLELKNHPSLSF